MKAGYKISLLVIITLLVISTSLATSYSLWTVTESQTSSNVITAGCFDITFNDLNSNNESTSINLNNTYPIPDEIGVTLAPYKVTITNNCTIAADYKLIISDLIPNTLDISNIKVYLTKPNSTYGPALLDTLTSYTMDNSIKDTIENEKNIEIKNSYVLSTGILNPDEVETYELRMWVKDEATDVMEQEFGAVVSYEAYASNPHS